MQEAASISHRIAGRIEPLLARYSRGGRVLAGVSGGCDSMVLLFQLHAAGFRKVTVCHLNHGLRGRAAAADARLVERETLRLGYRFVGEKVDVRAVAKEQRLSLETAARQVRLGFFTVVSRRERSRILFLAHHADDQVETFLFNLLRGTGAAGLVGMRGVTPMGRLEVVRPFLEIWRDELRAYALEQRVPFREDASNATLEYARNRIRLEAIPALREAVGRDPRMAILRTSQILAAENDFLQGLVPVFGETIPVTTLGKLPPALQGRALLGWLRQQGVPDVGYEAVQRVQTLLDPAHRVAKVNLPGAFHARRRAGQVFLEPPGR